MVENFIFGNESLFGISLAVVLLYILTYVSCHFRLQIGPKTALCINIFVCVVLLYITESRAGCLGFTSGLIYFYYQENKPNLSFQKKWAFSTVILAVLFLLLFWWKKGSSTGRILIYKISSRLFTNDWLYGIGWGDYKANYNLEQAAYFKENNFNSKEVLLADNTFFALNDFWQLLIEIGAVRCLVLALFMLWCFMYLRNFKIQHNRNHLFAGAIASIVCIVVSGFISYPFQVFILRMLIVISITLVLFCIEVPNIYHAHQPVFLFFARSVCCSIIIFLSCHGFVRVRQIHHTKLASELYQSGFKLQALSIYSNLRTSQFSDGATLYAHANLLYQMKRLEEAKIIIAEAKKFYTDNELYKLSARIAFEQGDLKTAEQDFLTAVYMVPNRMRSRHELMIFYHQKGDTAKAIFWCRAILQMPVKVSSLTTARLQKQTQEMLRTLENEN